MKCIIKITMNSFKEKWIYKSDAIFQFMNIFIFYYVNVCVWQAIFRSGHGKVTGASVAEMITYLTVSECIAVIVKTEVISEIDHKIRMGEIAMDLLKPVSLQLFLFWRSIGNMCFRFITCAVPMFAIANLIWDIEYPPIPVLLVVAVMVCNGMVIQFLLSFFMGLTGFWYPAVWHLERVLDVVTRLFAGSFIPLWLFPQALRSIAEILPFQYIYYIPISVFIQKTHTSYRNIILLQIVWIFGLYVLCRMIYRMGRKKLTLQGGW